MNAGSAAEAAATRKAAKYAGLERTHIFQPVAVENLGLGTKTRQHTAS